MSELTLLVWWWQLNREWQKKIGYIDFYKIFTNVNVVLIAVKTFRGLKQGRRCMTLMNLRTLCDVFPVPVGKWKQYRMVGLVKQNKIKQSFVWKIKARKKSENCIIYIFQEIVEYYFVFLDSFSLVVYLNLCTKEFLSYREMIQFQSQTEWQSNIFSRYDAQFVFRSMI